jgi:hypothetical protein
VRPRHWITSFIGLAVLVSLLVFKLLEERKVVRGMYQAVKIGDSRSITVERVKPFIKHRWAKSVVSEHSQRIYPALLTEYYLYIEYSNSTTVHASIRSADRFDKVISEKGNSLAK